MSKSSKPMLLLALLFALLPLAAFAQPTADELAARYLPLQMQAGTWDAEVTFYNKGQPSGTARGVQVNRLLANGHWITNEFSIPATDALPAYEGHGVWGYDPAAKTYVDTWVDTNDGAVRTSYGYWNATDTTMTWSSKFNDAQGHFIDYRITEEFRGDQRIFTFHQLGIVTPNLHPLVRIVFTRRSSD